MKNSAKHLYSVFNRNAAQALLVLNGHITQDEFALSFDWETRSLVFANKPIRKFFRRIGLYNPDGREAMSIASLVAHGIYSNEADIEKFYCQQGQIQDCLTKKNIIKTWHAYGYRGNFYKVCMGIYRLGNFRKTVNLRIISENIQREEFERLVSEGKQFAPPTGLLCAAI